MATVTNPTIRRSTRDKAQPLVRERGVKGEIVSEKRAVSLGANRKEQTQQTDKFEAGEVTNSERTSDAPGTVGPRAGNGLPAASARIPMAGYIAWITSGTCAQDREWIGARAYAGRLAWHRQECRPRPWSSIREGRRS